MSTGRRSTAAAVGLAGVLLVGCTVGPNFRSPATPGGSYLPTRGSQRSPATGTPALVYGAPIAADWFHLLGSSTLDDLIRRALHNNPDLQAARANISEARARLREVSGSAYPQVSGRALANRAHLNPTALGLSVPGGASDNNLFAGLLQFSYDLDVFGKLRRETEAQQAAVEYARDRALAEYTDLVNQVVSTAFDLATAQSLIDATEKLVDAQRRQLDLTRLQERVGTVARAQTLTAKAQLQGTEATLPGLRQRRAAARDALAALVGETPSTFQAPELRLSDFKLPTKLPVSLPSQLVRQRPDLLAAEQQLRRASAKIGIAAADRLPSFSLSANYGSLSDHGADFFNAGNALWTLGGNITAPLFDGGRLAAKEDQAKAAYLRADAQYHSTALKAFSQVATSLRALDNDSATLQARERALDTAHQALQLSSDELSTGTADALQLLTAQQEYRRELLSRIDAQARRFTDVAALIHALGGGWWNSSSDPVPALDVKHADQLQGKQHG